MVRETRHLWVGNLPDNIREDRIREHFKRYGRVQNVKLLGRMEGASASSNGGANSGVCATVAFMDIKSASKAHNVEHLLDERTLTTEYYEPAAIPSSAGAPSAGSSPAGSGYSGSSSSVNSAPAPVSTSRYHLSGEESAGTVCAMAASAAAPATWRGTNDSATEYCRRGNTPAAYGRYQRNSSSAPYATPPPSNVDRSTPHHRWYGSGERGGGAGGESTPSTPGGGAERRRRLSGSGTSRSRSRSESSSPEPSDTSRASTPAPPPPPSTLNSARRSPPTNTLQWPSTANGRPVAICVRNLPTRSTDSSLKDGLYHEYKKHGKVVWVKVVGQNADRYAVVRFKKPSDVDKALEVSQDKLFFGCKISVAPHQSCDDDAESAKPYETDIDEYHPKATRTLFIGNLEKDVTQQQLREKFKHFGRIIEIDIKKGSGGGAGYAFCQYASISSVVEAIRAMDGEYVGSSRVKLGFGKPVATTCVWVDGLTEHTEKQVLGAVSRCGAATSVCVDRAAGAALVHFEQAAAAGGAVRELRRVAAQLSAAEPDHPRLCVDYASRECQEAFYEQLEKHGGSSTLAGAERVGSELAGRYLATPRHDPLRYDTTGSRSRAPSFGRSTSRTPRYATHEVYDPAEYAAERRYRVYEELGSSPQTDEANFEDRLQSVVVSPHRGHKHRRDSSPEDRKHSKERHRSAGGSSRRSRSGSRGERHGVRRRHRRRRDGSGSRGSRTSRTGTPLRDELDAPPTEPRRPPRERPPLPMSLPLPKFAVQLLRAAPTVPQVLPPPAPASPPRPPSVSSSSGGSAPHSPSLEERIRSLDEKYERWTGSRAHMDAPDRARLRHRLLELDINEVKPSEVVRSLLAKRSVFDEDSERLEVATRAPSPGGSPRSLTVAVPRTLRYPFPSQTHVPMPAHTPPLTDSEDQERTSDPRLYRSPPNERLSKIIDTECNHETNIRPRTPSTDKNPLELSQMKLSSIDRDHSDLSKEERKRRNSVLLPNDDTKICQSAEKNNSNKCLSDKQFENSVLMELHEKGYSSDSFTCSEDKSSFTKSEGSLEGKSTVKCSNFHMNKFEINCFRNEEKPKNIDTKPSLKDDSVCDVRLNSIDKCTPKNDVKLNSLSESKDNDNKTENESDNKSQNVNSWKRKDSDWCNEKFGQNNSCKDIHPITYHNSVNRTGLPKKISEGKCNDKNTRNKYENNVTVILNNENYEKENFELNKTSDKIKPCNTHFSIDKKNIDPDKNIDENLRTDKQKSAKEKVEKDIDKEKPRSIKSIKIEKNDKEKKSKDEMLGHKNNHEKLTKIKLEKEDDKVLDKDRDTDKTKHEEKYSRHENHKKDKSERDRKKELPDPENVQNKIKKDDRKHDKPRRESNDIKREIKKESDSKTRKSSRDESSRDISRKDSTDSSTSRTSHESTKSKDADNVDGKEENKVKIKLEIEKEFKPLENKLDGKSKLKNESKEDKDTRDNHPRIKTESIENGSKMKGDLEKQRHYSLDSPTVESKRKERLNSCSSLPPGIGHKRRMSSHESVDYFVDDNKKSKNDVKYDRHDGKDTRNIDKLKSTKFNKGHFAKIIESKTKDDKKNQVKPPDDIFCEEKDVNAKETAENKNKYSKKNSYDELKEKVSGNSDTLSEQMQNNFDLLASLELRSSEEDERQKALRKEMKEKKRIQQLQQIQELQMQQADAIHNTELLNRIKDDRKQKCEEKKKESIRDKRMSTERKSKDEKNDHTRRKNRKQTQSSDTSDSDEPKKHSIFDIVDDGPTYISMYDKVKARSCKNMQKQEEEKRQEKIKAKFSQLKQSRAKREEKKRSSWDEDSDSEHDRRKTVKVSMNSSSDDQNSTHGKKRETLSSSLDYEHSRDNDFFNNTSNDADFLKKLSRKNSRTRIISDTSDDEVPTIRNKTPFNSINKDIHSVSHHKPIDSDTSLKDCCEDNMKKTSLINLFGKSDSEDNRQKLTLDVHNEFRMSYVKSFPNDLSSESESNALTRMVSEIRKKHKKKQRKYKFFISDDDVKHEHSNNDTETEKQKNFEKTRRHSNKKEKRKDRMRESIDTEESRDDKLKVLDKKRSPSQSYDLLTEIQSNSIKKEGRMEDIFGPLSDESDKERSISLTHNKSENTFLENESAIGAAHSYEIKINSNNTYENKLKDKDENNKRKRERKRKEKKLFTKEDENSLDVDAVSKAIEARLFDDVINTDENRSKLNILPDVVPLDIRGDYKGESKGNAETDILNYKHTERLKRDSRDKKKKKKRSREDKRNRKTHHHFYHDEKNDKIDCMENVELSPKILLDIPLPNDTQKLDDSHKVDDNKSLLESPSLPRITDSPAFVISSDNINVKIIDSPLNRLIVDEKIDIDYDIHKPIEVAEIPMPPPIENIVQDISEVPLPKDPPIDSDNRQRIICAPDYDINKDVDSNEDAVRSISNLDDEQKDKNCMESQALKVDKKIEEKPRAVISQEETEDAVAALLGESFGGKVNIFPNCYEEVEISSTCQTETENTVTENEIIPEEDAEEMRQAVQNLNASAMEMKPDTPVSDNDLLLIDTDTEENEENSQDAIERLPVNIIATNQSLNNNTKKIVSASSETSNVIIAKPHLPHVNATKVETKNEKENENKLQVIKHDTIQVTSTATPVITSWTLSGNKIVEPKLINISSSQISNMDTDTKPTHITANIVKIKSPQTPSIQINNSLRPIVNSSRISAPYKVINQVIRPQGANMQPPTIKIPEPHIIYQKPPGIVISPRMTSDPRLLSPKTSPQNENLPSSRLTNMTIINTSSQSLNAVGMVSPPAQQRSPGQVTVVRMQQPPLSPIQTMHIPHGSRTMVSPSRPKSVLVQTQGTSIHLNRLPVAPVLTPITKQLSANNIIQQKSSLSNTSVLHQQNTNNIIQQQKSTAVTAGSIIHQQNAISIIKQQKPIGVNTSSVLHQQNTNNIIQQQKSTGVSTSPVLHQKNVVPGECRKTENMVAESKIIITPTTLQHGSNPIIAQNRLIAMQNAIHVSKSTIHLPNKVLVTNKNQLIDKRENQLHKSEHTNLPSFVQAPIMQMAASANRSNESIIQSSSKPAVCNVQESSPMNRGQGSNVIHTVTAQRLLTASPSSINIQVETNKSATSVLSMAPIRSSPVLTKCESNSLATTSSLTNVVMTPLLLTTNNTKATIRLQTRNDGNCVDNHASLQSISNPLDNPAKDEAINQTISLELVNTSQDNIISKSETDFEELLKENTNEINVTNDTEKKIEVNLNKIILQNQNNLSCENLGDKSNSHPCLVNESKEILTVIRNEDFTIDKIKIIEENKTSSITDIEKTKPDNLLDLIKEEDGKETPIQDVQNESKNDFKIEDKSDPNTYFIPSVSESQNGESQDNNLDENEFWSAKDINIESVIKKVDSLCNDSHEEKTHELNVSNLSSNEACLNVTRNEVNVISSDKTNEAMDINEKKLETIIEVNNAGESLNDKISSTNKRGGRNSRGRKPEKNQDKVQTRKITKPTRGIAKRGRNRCKVDKKVKHLVNSTLSNIPGDVYDFHEDSGDETSTSPNKTESRPRLILTIKSPVSGNSNATATSTLSITQKEQLKIDKPKDEKPEVFASPSTNTRKSRRLQEKDIQRTTVDDVIDDVIKSSTGGKPNKEGNKKRTTRQAAARPSCDKTAIDTRKSPRGTKRQRDRSLSDASMDSNEESKKEDLCIEPKIPKLLETPQKPAIPISKSETEITIKPIHVVTQVASCLPVNPTPITKPPKKMISEISAKLACNFDAPVNVAPKGGGASPIIPDRLVQPLPERQEIDRHVMTRDIRSIEPVSVGEDLPVATGEVSGMSAAEMGHVRRLVDNVPSNMMPVGATEATDARVRSPALPHRPPSTHRPTDRATPILVRSGGAEAGTAGALAAGGVGAGTGASRGLRGAYPGPASLPRGAHHPVHAPHAPSKPAAVHSPGAHHHPASRVTITSVPAISPQGQLPLSAELARSPPPAHQQTSPITSGEGVYPHFSHHHYQMYQQHFRATQHENRTTPTPFTRALEAEGSEAPTSPLELRRPPSARVPRPAHSPSPADRHMYGVRCGRSPPPAHGTSRPPAALPPATTGPPHASQVPREADSLQMLLRRYPVMWQGLLALKNDSAAVQMHFVGGNPGVAADALSRSSDGSQASLLRIAQRMRLEPTQLDQVHRKMKLELEHCILLALPCGRDHMDVLQQSTNLTAGFITYLQRKQAAGIVNVAPTPGHQQSMYTVHIFPSCDFANENLTRIAPDLMHRVANIAHLLIVIATAIG